MPFAFREDLLNPIPGANPSGVSLRYATTYDKIKEARREDDDAPQGEWQRERKIADFNAVLKVAGEALAEKSKDLQLAAWLTEALLRKEGFGGLLLGLGVLNGLVSTFWETLYPEIEDGDLEMRAAPLDWVGSYLGKPLKMAPFTRSGLGFFKFQESRSVGYEAQADENSSRRETFDQAKKDGKLSADDFDVAVKSTPTASYQGWVNDLDGSLDAVESLNSLCEEKFGSGGPSFSTLQSALEEVRNVVKGILNKRLEAEAPAAVVVPDEVEVEQEPEIADATPVHEPVSATPPAAPAKRSKLTGIEPADSLEATLRLAAIAKFLRQNDAYDPAPYLMLRGYRWGETRRQGSSPDASFLMSPPTEVRQTVKRLASEGSWTEMLEAAETAMAEPYGRGWMDLQRYVVTALESSGNTGIAAAIRSELRALLADLPELLAWTFDDDTPVANAETQAWLKELLEVQEPAAAAEEEYAPPPRLSHSDPDPDPVATGPDTYTLAMDKVRSGRVEEAIDMLAQDVASQQSGRGRYQCKVQLAQLCLASGRETLALPILEELLETIDRYSLDTWEAPGAVAHTLALLYTCLDKTQGDIAVRRKIYTRICRLDPMQALAVSR